MTAVMSEPRAAAMSEPKAIVLSAEEYDALPPNSRIELVDGVVHVMATPTRRHQVVVTRLEHALEVACPDDLVVTREQEVRLSELLRRNPDLMVVTAEADDLNRSRYEASEVMLAVEVVSPGTETVDRKHKPAEYAGAGIHHFWRVETTPELVLHTFRLGETGIYLETGLFGSGDTTAIPGLPWAKIAIDDLVP